MFFFFGQSKHYVISKPKKYLAHSDLTWKHGKIRKW